MAEMQFGQYRFEVSERNKILFPEIGITKGDLIDYYVKIADVMLPHISGRPLNLQRFPGGIEEEGFFQYQRSDYFPDWIKTVITPRASDRRQLIHRVVCNNQATLAYLANQAVITLYGWLARDKNIKKPDRLVFDLDPPQGNFTLVKQAAHWIRELMQELGMKPYVMTTGSRGLHVVAPIKSSREFDSVRDYAKAMAQYLASCYPEQLTVEQRRNKRKGRLYLNVMRNAYGQTMVLPYTVRARSLAPVAAPISWEELDSSELHAQTYTISNIFHRLGQRNDPWQAMDRHAVDVNNLPDPESVEIC